MFHKFENCTRPQSCMLHVLPHMAESFDKVCREVRPMAEKLDNIAKAFTYSLEYRQNHVKDGDERTFRQILDDIDRKLTKTADLQEAHQEGCQ